jgi:hypothetical protein
VSTATIAAIATAMSSPATIESPVLNLKELAAYCRRTPRAMYALRDRRNGPPMFRKAGRLYAYKVDVDEWLASGYAADPGSNPDLDPTRRGAEPRRNGDGARGATLTPLAEHAPTASSSH